MALQTVFNPFTGKFDFINSIPASSGPPSTPTTMQQNLVIADHTQLVFRRKIVMNAGQRITIGTDAALVGV